MDILIRQATSSDVRSISEIIVEDWQKAYQGIIDSAYLESLNVEDRYNREINRFQVYTVAECNGEILGCEWTQSINEEYADCEVVALYVKDSYRGKGIGKALLQKAITQFKNNGKKNMIIWCLSDNIEARKFYEKMGGKEYSSSTHSWGDKDYNMTSYLYDL